jgi:4'-phosphopantetheinyl transferase
MTASLDKEERERADRFRFERHRRLFMARRAIQRNILARYLGQPPQELRFEYARFGKATIAAANPHTDFRFNATSSGTIALLGVACGRAIGIDVEALRPLDDTTIISRSVFSPTEREKFERLEPQLRGVSFLQCWTRKEAFVKAIGRGLSFPLEQIDVTVGPGVPAELLGVRGGAVEASEWQLQDLDVGVAYVGALAVEGDGWSLTQFEWAFDE